MRDQGIWQVRLPACELAWLIMRDEDAQTDALRSAGSAVQCQQDERPLPPALAPRPGRAEVLRPAMDGPDRVREKRSVIPEFSRIPVAGLRLRRRSVAAEIVDAIRAGQTAPADLVEQPSYPVAASSTARSRTAYRWCSASSLSTTLRQWPTTYSCPGSGEPELAHRVGGDPVVRKARRTEGRVLLQDRIAEPGVATHQQVPLGLHERPGRRYPRPGGTGRPRAATLNAAAGRAAS